MTAHIHAENMKLYAQDAAETDKPWERWEQLCGDGVWRAFTGSHPHWYVYRIYRCKPRTHKVNGFEVPEPMRDAPKDGSDHWLADPLADSLCHRTTYAAERHFERGLVHATKEAAIANAKAMLGISP